METNEITGQGQPGQNPQPEQPQHTPVLLQPQSERPEQLLSATAPAPPEPDQPPLYNPGLAARMAELIRDVFDPAYILLFGTLAKGTPHSDALCYDILIATHDTP